MGMGSEHRKANGQRYKGDGLAAKVASEIAGMMLAQAYVVVKNAGYRLKVTKLDGVPHSARVSDDMPVINVEVNSGFVKKSWHVRA